MSWARADWSPIADQIRSFGTGLANVALRKQQLQRQLGKDLVDYDMANANMDLTRAKTQREQMDMDNIDRLASMFDPGTLTPEQRTAAAVNAMAPRNVMGDALRAAKLGQEVAQAKELFDNGTPVERLSIVTGSAVKPYALNGKTGAVINQMTGEVTADTPLAARILGGRGGSVARSIDPEINTSLINQIYTRTIRAIDPLGVERISNLPDADAQQRDMRIAALMGLPWNAETAYGLRTGLITVPPAVAQTVGVDVTQPPQTATPAAAKSKKDWTAGLGVDPVMQPQVNALLQMYYDREISQDLLVQKLKELGFEE